MLFTENFLSFFLLFSNNFWVFFINFEHRLHLFIRFECRIKLTWFSDEMKAFTVDSHESCELVNDYDVDDNDYNADSKMTIIHADKTAMSPRFVVDLTLLFL